MRNPLSLLSIGETRSFFHDILSKLLYLKSFSAKFTIVSPLVLGNLEIEFWEFRSSLFKDSDVTAGYDKTRGSAVESNFV